MRDILAHRGPDGRGLMIDGPVGLAHTRLAIVDVTGGQQPMCNEDGSVWIVFNGEIYNHATLRPGLQARGHRYRTRCDTETILHLYEEEGDRVVDQLHGMFAFAIWDRRAAAAAAGARPPRHQAAVLRRDDTDLVFASEIKAVLAAASFARRSTRACSPSSSRRASSLASARSSAACGNFCRVTCSPGPRTRECRRGATGICHRRQRRPRTINRRPDEHARLLETAVDSHLMSDVPLGVFLSGGIDSSVLAALVARAAKGRVKTFAVGFDEREANELPYARLAADHLGAEHRDVTVTPAAFVNALPRLLWHEDEPIAFPSSVPLHFVARLASEHVKVVLTGEGADELFLGYNRYRVTRWNARLGRPYWTAVPRAIRRQVRGAVRALPPPLGRIARRTFVALEPGIRDLYFENFAVFPSSLQQQMLRRDLLDADDPYTVELRCFNEAPGGLLDRICRVDLQTYLLELLMKQDQMSMAASIESRVPFLDDRLVEHVVAMPGDVKLRGWQTKAILRDAVKDLIPPRNPEPPQDGVSCPARPVVPH